LRLQIITGPYVEWFNFIPFVRLSFHNGKFRIPNFDYFDGDVTGQQRMLTPPWHLILLSLLSGVGVAVHSILYLLFSLRLRLTLCSLFDMLTHGFFLELYHRSHNDLPGTTKTKSKLSYNNQWNGIIVHKIITWKLVWHKRMRNAHVHFIYIYIYTHIYSVSVSVCVCVCVLTILSRQDVPRNAVANKNKSLVSPVLHAIFVQISPKDFSAPPCI
jgi:hypothetical protein